MVTTIFHGELGNNIFQLAALLSLKDEMQIDYEIINQRISWVSSFRPLEIENLFEKKFKFVESHTQNYQLYHHTDLHKQIPNYSFAYNPIPRIDNINIRGYFQSEKYFLNIKNKLIQEYFQPKQAIVDYIVSKYFSLLKNSVAIHFRAGGDRPSCHDKFPLLSKEYYNKSLDILQKNQKIEKILIFSDNMDIAKKIFSSNCFFIENESNIVDLIFMSMCEHNIIGNSTFSWWAAYLNKNNNKKIIAPKTKWFDGELSELNRDDLFPEAWITL